eukprot:gene42699-52971_t
MRTECASGVQPQANSRFHVESQRDFREKESGVQLELIAQNREHLSASPMVREEIEPRRAQRVSDRADDDLDESGGMAASPELSSAQSINVADSSVQRDGEGERGVAQSLWCRGQQILCGESRVAPEQSPAFSCAFDSEAIAVAQWDECFAKILVMSRQAVAVEGCQVAIVLSPKVNLTRLNALC